tara:strand:- start:117 stop:1034 length:918 start_codon:yes stop_codon:yes gene_type:complete
MAALGSQSIASSFEQLLHVDADGGGNGTTHVSVKDGDNGTTFGFTIATDALMMTGTNRLEFGDTGTYIHQSADGVLDLVSDTEIEINATTIDMNGAVVQDGGNFTINEDSGDYDFRVESDGNANMFFVNGGNNKVGIGTGSPSYVLDVESSANDWVASIVNSASSGNAFCQQLQFSGVSPNNTTSKFQQFIDGGSTVRFEVRSNGGVVNFQSNDADLSDETVKENIVDAPNCLDTINNIKVRNFKYKDQTDSRTLIGVIAQEVEAVSSSLVDDSEELKRVYNKDIMFMMLKAIQELSDKVEALEA